MNALIEALKERARVSLGADTSDETANIYALAYLIGTLSDERVTELTLRLVELNQADKALA